MVIQTVCNANTAQLNYQTYVNKRFLANPASLTGTQSIDKIEYYKCANFLASSIVQQPTNRVLRKCNYDFPINTRLFDELADTDNVCDDDIWSEPGGDRAETSKITNDYYQDAFLQSGNCQQIAANNLPQITSQGKQTQNSRKSL